MIPLVIVYTDGGMSPGHLRLVGKPVAFEVWMDDLTSEIERKALEFFSRPVAATIARKAIFWE